MKNEHVGKLISIVGGGGKRLIFGIYVRPDPSHAGCLCWDLLNRKYRWTSYVTGVRSEHFDEFVIYNDG